MALPAEETRRKLVEITLDLMEEGGIEAVKARELARRAGVSVGTIYNMHGNLDGLIAEACNAVLADFASTAIHAIRAGEATRVRRLGGVPVEAKEVLRDRLLAMARIYMAYVEKNERRWAAMLAWNRAYTGEARQSEQLQGELFGLIRSALEATPYGGDPKLQSRTARMLWSAVHGIVTMNYVGQASRASKAETWEQVRLLVAAFVDSLDR